MAKHLPDYHSPLLALGKKVLLWSIAPAALVVAVIYSMATDTSDDPFFPAARIEREQSNRRAMQDYEQKRRDAYSTADDIVRRAQKGGK